MLREIDNWMFATYLKITLGIESFVKKENGEANIIAVILILAIVVALVIIFRKNIAALWDKIWTKTGEDADAALTGDFKQIGG